MSDINLEQIKNMRAQFRKEAESIRSQINVLQTQLIQCEERVQVYDELLKGQVPSPEQLTMQGQGRFHTDDDGLMATKKSRTARTTKAEMQRRRNVLVSIFKEHGSMKPSDLLPLVSEAVGTEVEPHQLRAILRRFDQVFEGKAEHGMWGLTAEGAQSVVDEVPVQSEMSSTEDFESESE